MAISRLTKTKRRPNKKKVYGFDIETYDSNREFYCATVYLDEKHHWTFYDKDELIAFFKQHRFRDSFIVATNLSFDFFGTFFSKEEQKGFHYMWNGSSLLCAKTYVDKNGFNKHNNDKAKPITFIDTLNYCQMSVEQIGELLGLPKLEQPDFIGYKPQTIKEYCLMEAYNIRDAEISKRYIDFLFESFYELGATPKMTIASTAMSLFRNRFMDETDVYYRHDEDILLEQFEGYYGGRVEAFCRGVIRNAKYFDINSLYPFMMLNSLPDPNCVQWNHKNKIDYIMQYEGMAKVDIFCPHMEYPLLPVRKEGKLLFPTGNFSGWYTNIELRKAVELGYTIKKVHKTYFYKKTCTPFKEYVTTLYNLRKIFKEDGNTMEAVVKLLMNALYGKFGQKFKDKDDFQPFDMDIDQISKYKDKHFEIVGDFVRTKADRKPSPFCIPIWSSYITAMGRIEIHKYIVKYRAIYCDTDSVITYEDIPTGTELGDMKLEMDVKEGFIVRPKFYAVHPQVIIKDKVEPLTKIKGLGKRLTYGEFKSFIVSPSVTYTKFLKVKEAIRRGMIPNEAIEFTKTMSLDDDKRDWEGQKFNPLELQLSKPKEMMEENDEVHKRTTERHVNNLHMRGMWFDSKDGK